MLRELYGTSISGVVLRQGLISTWGERFWSPRLMAYLLEEGQWSVCSPVFGTGVLGYLLCGHLAGMVPGPLGPSGTPTVTTEGG